MPTRYLNFNHQLDRHSLHIQTEVRARIEESGNIRATSFDRLPPVISPSLGFLVKYGGNVTILEAQTQMVVHQRLQGNVSMPEILG
ncbi:hypothetical protein LZ31DRAFT_601898 [Colletotrichum somersetense]|nr:hypothetical protein LZ31DRAFT_601898 [Colletotrichum somersetense]